MVPPSKSPKIELNREYPCPCRRRGKLVPIILTEAMGCDRCQQIFVITENNHYLEQLSSAYPYQRLWRWTGKRWVSANFSRKETYLSITLGTILLLLLVWSPLILSSARGMSVISWFLIALLLASLPAILVWLTYRR